MERRTKAATESGVLLLIIAAILVAVNALSAIGGYKRIDTTKAEKYTLSRGSANLVKSLKKDKIKVDAYVTKGLPKLDAFVRDLRDLLLEYQANSDGKFEFRIIEAKEEKDKETAKEAGLVAQSFADTNQDEDKLEATKGYMGLVFNYGTERDAIKFLPPGQTDGLEFWITNKIREVRDKAEGIKHKIGVLQGHDEIKLTDANLAPPNAGRYAIQPIITQNFTFYQFQDVDLKGGEAEIDDTLDGLIITQPGKDITEKELRRIDQFVMKGKSLAVFASAVNVKASDATMNAELNNHGLDKLLEGYGIKVKKDVVLDFGRSFRVGVMTQTGMPATALFPQFVNVEDDSRYEGDEKRLDTAFPSFFRVPQVIWPFASSVELDRTKQPEVAADKMKIIARSTQYAIHETSDKVDLKPFRAWKPKGTWEQFGLAATVEGPLKSAFLTGDKQGVEAPEKSKAPARVLVISSSQYLANPLARAGAGQEMGGQMMGMPPQGGDEQLQQLAMPYAQLVLTTTILSFKNTLDWITGDTDLLAVSAKILAEPTLSYGQVEKPGMADDEEAAKKRDDEAKQIRHRTQIWIEIVLILGLPLLFVLYGLIRWQMRMSSRQKVSLA
jgi:ABC-type uncharacterized transport system involved in gliding motility auxiliary subunit